MRKQPTSLRYDPRRSSSHQSKLCDGIVRQHCHRINCDVVMLQPIGLVACVRLGRTAIIVCSGSVLLQRHRHCCEGKRVRLSAPVRTYATMETGQGSSTVTVSPPEILAGKEVQPSAPKAILRTDYRPTPYLVSDVHLCFLLGDTTRVKSRMYFVPNYKGSPPALALDGKPATRKPPWHSLIDFSQLIQDCISSVTSSKISQGVMHHRIASITTLICLRINIYDTALLHSCQFKST